ncbi:hypothetical protein G3435_20175 [Pseudomonas sp. MAFF212428]|uniref:Lipoprotein n=1 Tax=Pseudomonas brassicae TaxID=2708063 RepID=A0A6B3NVE6_9PSED|nr:hypothetical protein [Pseudomonas brassicae]NER61640.1 hypothetical protein [Pseudomonas brassicae]NER66099.1 hypothetical protein [Pseudomonas brassicae]
MSSLIRTTLLGLLLAGVVGCTTKPLLTPQEQLSLTRPVSHEQVKQAIVQTVTKRGWSVRRVTPEQIQADILVRNTFFAAVNIDYSATGYRINYRDSRELDYKDGKIHRNYNRWVKALDNNILRELKNQQALQEVQRALDQQHSTLN